MTVGELIERLSDMNQDLEVRLVADHGQSAMAVTDASIGYIEEQCWMAEELHPDDVTDKSIKVAIVEAF